MKKMLKRNNHLVLVVVVLCMTTNASSAFSDSPSSGVHPSRLDLGKGDTGGGDSDSEGESSDTKEKEAIDHYIDKLIETYDDSSESSFDHVNNNGAPQGATAVAVIQSTNATDDDIFKAEEQQDTTAIETTNDSSSNVTGILKVNDAAVGVDDTEESVEIDVVTMGDRHEVADTNGETELEHIERQQGRSSDAGEASNKRKKRKRRQSDTVQNVKVPVKETNALKNDVGAVKEASLGELQQQQEQQQQQQQQQQTLGPARPNALYRFLLHQGRLGHILVMICVLITELVQTYLPPVAHLIAYLCSFFVSSDMTRDGGRRRDDPFSGRRDDDASKTSVNAQYAAFVSSDGSTVRGKKRKQQVRKADQQAAEKLRRVGSIQDAKFRHVSQDFMKRHRIGSYRDSKQVETESSVVSKELEAHTSTAAAEEEDSDVDWVVEALSIEKNAETPVSSTSTGPIKPFLGLDVDSRDGATISVGLEFGGGTVKRKKRRRKTLAEAATERTPVLKKKPVGPRSSDRDGGGGVIGRIRAAGANNLVSRSLLGAYPGDAVPPSEAGSANGVMALAEKYGYGDWSDDDYDEDEEDKDNENTRGISRRRVKRKHQRRRQQSNRPSSRGGGASLQFGLSSSTSTISKRTAQRPSSTKRKKARHIKDPVPSTEKSEILLGSAARQLSERQKPVQVRPPLEKLNQARAKAARRKENDE